MSKQTFSRINVDINSLNVSAPGRSGFDLSKSSMQSIPFGKLYPVRCTKLMPNSTVKGSVNPDLQLEKFATPAAGRMRLDTHTFMVAAKRIHKDFKQFIESGQVGYTALSLPTLKMSNLMSLYFTRWIRAYGATYTAFDDMLTPRKPAAGSASGWNPSLLYLRWLSVVVNGNLSFDFDPSTLHTYLKNIADYFTTEYGRLDERLKVLQQSEYFTDLQPSDDSMVDWLNNQYYLGDFLYDVFFTLFGEGSTLDQLGYPIMSYYGSMRERLNNADMAARSAALLSATVTNTWDETALDAYIAYFDSFTFDYVLNIASFEDDEFVQDSSWNVSLSEMPLRANYAVWFDYFRDWHLDKEMSCPNPDDWGANSLFTLSDSTTNLAYVICMLAPRSRNWSRDGFTMVQPDDVYRHVYAPASTVPGDSDIYQLSSDGFDTLFANVEGGFAGSVSLPFPSSFTNLFGTLSQNVDTYYHDLQTMRRAEMLKRKLTRDYYNPDTYVGQHIARWGVEPADFAIQCTQYLGGSESMITGDQITSPVETDSTTLGQRTLVANASSNDSFVYNMSEWAYLISYVSIVPLVHYDALNPTLQEISVHDQPIPEYANDNQVLIRTCDLVRDYFTDGFGTALGYVARYYGYRMALDDAHGKYLREYRPFVWLRDRKTAGDSMLTKNAINAHVNMSLDCFIGLREWNTIAFGNIQLPLFVECALPDKLENV